MTNSKKTWVLEHGKTIMSVLALMLVASAAQAGTIATTDDFYRFFDFINKNLKGGLGVGIALVSMVVGAGVGAMKSSALPMIVGFVIAAFFAFGPGIIVNMIAGSAEITPKVLLQLQAEQVQSVLSSIQ